MNKILSQRDLEFLLYEWLDVDALTTRPRYLDHSHETFQAALETSRQIATDLFAPHNKKSDANEPRVVATADGDKVQLIAEIKTALDAFSAAGLIAAGQDFDLGGMQLPCVIEKACMAWFMGANVATAAYPFLTTGNANLLLTHGTAEQIEKYARPLLTGRFLGTMCLSEPHAGSSLGDIKTRAEPESDGSYRLTGNKMWISGGDHELSENIIHLVLAKIPDEKGKLIAGTKGISLFLVPKFLVHVDQAPGERNDVALAGLNHKMGYRGTTNCLLNFGEGKYLPLGKPGAVGYLVGEKHQGLACMFHMMNEARIGVGLGATMLGYTGYLHALDYARNRPQGRATGVKDPTTAQSPIIEHADVRRMLLAQKTYVEGALALNLYCARLVDEQRTGEDESSRREASLLLDILTPIAKSWPSQWCLEANSLAIQVHGGYGYTRDYNVEQFYRDNRLNPIHEGTHGIQGLDLLGRKVIMQDGAALTLLVSRIEDTLHLADEDGDLTEWVGEVFAMLDHLVDATHDLHAAENIELTLANASIYLEAFGHVVMAWMWIEQALVATRAANRHGDFYRGKLQACQYFIQWELPKVRPMLNLLEALDATTLHMRDAWF
jgi:alkylation response protein AidB-like acyl-CoA dehydrogenase